MGAESHFVDFKSLPLYAAEFALVLEDELVCGEQDVELELLGASKLVLSDDLSTLAGAHIADDVHVRRPVLELHLPGGNRRERDNDQERPKLLSLMEEIREI